MTLVYDFPPRPKLPSSRKRNRIWLYRDVINTANNNMRTAMLIPKEITADGLPMPLRILTYVDYRKFYDHRFKIYKQKKAMKWEKKKKNK
jgi:hypothetical protein